MLDQPTLLNWTQQLVAEESLCAQAATQWLAAMGTLEAVLTGAPTAALAAVRRIAPSCHTDRLPTTAADMRGFLDSAPRTQAGAPVSSGVTRAEGLKALFSQTSGELNRAMHGVIAPRLQGVEIRCDEHGPQMPPGDAGVAVTLAELTARPAARLRVLPCERATCARYVVQDRTPGTGLRGAKRPYCPGHATDGGERAKSKQARDKAKRSP